jgi:hypothetical protein
MSSPELPRPDENPFQPPQQPSRFTVPNAPDDPERRRRRRIMLTLVGVLLVPVATLIGAGMGCTAGMGALVAIGNEQVALPLFFLLIAAGAIAGGGVTIYLLVRAAKRP